jgi:hypothetical protein
MMIHHNRSMININININNIAYRSITPLIKRHSVAILLISTKHYKRFAP